jgi:DNA-binding IclR family transcriptional regulator
MTPAIETTPQERIRSALADMLPSTAAEIAEATGLEAVTAAACLEALAARCEVMFNPLTKRFSLPKSRPSVGLAA